MKKTLLSLLLLLSVLGVAAQSEVVIATAQPYGETFSFTVETANAADSVYVDWGDGVRKSYKAGRYSWHTNTYVSGKLLNDTIHVYGSLERMDMEDLQMTVLQLKNQTNLKKLYAQHNLLTNDGLDISGATNIEILDLSDNQMTNLNLINFDKLEMFDVNNNPEFNTAVFASGNGNLTSIHMDNCDIVHFYPIELPNLQYLSLRNSSLMDIEIGTHYPKLSSLTLSGSTYLSSVDVTSCPDLFSLDLGRTGITEINVTNNTKLNSIDVNHTKIKALNLRNNTALTSVNAANTGISKLDVSMLTGLKNITVDSTNVARLDLTNKRFLRSVSARNTKIEFLDMHHVTGYNTLNSLDIRDNVNMTPQTLNFTFDAMPPHDGDSYRTNVFIQGSNGEHANTDLLSYDTMNYYKVDVEGDGTASMDSVDITTPVVEGGTYSLTQVGQYGADDSWHAITNKAMPGYPISVTAVPAEGYRYVGVKVNDKLYEDTICVVSAAATIQAVFVAGNANQVIKLTVPAGAPQQYAIGGRQPGDVITVDWGDGVPQEWTLGNTTTPVYNDNGTQGTTVTITGPVRHLDLSSYPGFGTENLISAVDISGNDSLRTLVTYMNEDIKTLDVSNEPELTVLDASYSGLTELNIANNPKLTSLRAYGNELTSVDLTTAPNLVELDLKNNMLAEVDMSNNPLLQKIQLQNNELEAIDVKNMPDLRMLNVQGNYLDALDVTHNQELISLAVSNNMLDELDLSGNAQLMQLFADGNRLPVLNLSANPHLIYINISSNGWTACDMNDFYWNLPEFKLPEGVNPEDLNLSTTLWLQGNTSSSKSENDAAHSETLIATGKGWVVSEKGDATGCDQVYVKVLPYENGEVHLYTADNIEIPSGTTVAKNSVVTISATPAEGYYVSTEKANGEVVMGDTFTPSVYTEILVQFSIATSIDAVGEDKADIRSGNGEIVVDSKKAVNVQVFSLNGKQMFADNVSGTQAISLPSGVYVVKVAGVSKTMLVK